jgi:hypothetical protein
MTMPSDDDRDAKLSPGAASPVSMTTRVVAGLGCVAFGAFILAAAFRLIPIEPSRGVPHWIVGVAGMCFSIAGVALLLPQRPSRLHDALGASLFTLFATMGVWVGFAPGERHFSGGVSIGPIAASGFDGEAVGRFAFGTMGVLVGLLAIFTWRRAFRKRNDDSSAPS